VLLERKQVVMAVHRPVATPQGQSRLENAGFAETLQVHLALEEQVPYTRPQLALGAHVRLRLRRLTTA
jgi:hypothetical protein